MNTDVNQFLIDLTYILACLSSVERKMTAYQLKTLLCWGSSLAICALPSTFLVNIFIPPYVTFNARDWSKSVD